ncbi:cell division protein FtsZ [Porphyromonas pogonae]|uniref:cell division protein FtsZ n=1 Tax=Porphyromonas pogonae TaxID=867595 RepID=UPI002E78C2B3|nr:cell division protein FtsZ [Porphyromonas pogonae]
MDENKLLDFDYKQAHNSPIIKVIGVGGGGGNAVENMFLRDTVHDVSFLLCNTDEQALKKSNVPSQIILGPEITRGLGAGNRPEKARVAAEQSREEIEQILSSDGTKMVFITAGMGGGTGTGAGPVIGRVALDMGLLTVGIVTIPFLFEGRNKILQALKGVQEMRKNVDALLVVNNERLRVIYKDLTLDNAFDKADDTLSSAARGISDMITRPGRINLDFADVQTTLKDGGVAIISTGYGSGENRMQKAIDEALNSPLLNNNDIFKARKVLINIYQSSDHPLDVNELDPIHEFTAKIETGFDNIWGFITDDSLGEQVAITILASGFDLSITTESIGDGLTPGKRKLPDAVSQQEEMRRTEQENELIGNYYGQDQLEKKIFKPLLLNIDELDDNDIIAIMEETPSLMRDPRPIEEIRMRKQNTISHNHPTTITGGDFDKNSNDSPSSTNKQPIRF